MLGNLKKKTMNQHHVRIGRGSKFLHSPDLASSQDAKITIGNFCAIAKGFSIIALNHDYNFPAVQGRFHQKYFKSLHPGELRRPPSRTRTKGDVKIGHDVWIGKDVFISSGVTIGDGCVVGARSVVTKDLPPFSVCVGTPCKPIKKRFSEEMIVFLMQLQWWNWNDEKIKKNQVFFFSDLNQISVGEARKRIQ